jgi:hypothetical protein
MLTANETNRDFSAGAFFAASKVKESLLAKLDKIQDPEARRIFSDLITEVQTLQMGWDPAKKEPSQPILGGYQTK